MQAVRDNFAGVEGGPLHVAIGMFDGVHLGHRAVIESAIHAARARGGRSAVLTFSPHPSRVLRPESPTLLIQGDAEKEERIAALGVDLILWQSFTRELAAVGAEEYAARLKAALPGLATLHVGENFRFGRGRTGDIQTLLAAAKSKGVHLISIERVRYDGEPISSTRIRSLLSTGRMAEADALLGYDYFSDGVVVPGKKLGRTIGFPTLNIAWQPESAPAFGVYAVRVYLKNKGRVSALPAVANYGLRPSVENARTPLLEIHVLAPECPIGEGDAIRAEWLEFLRPETKFDSLDALRVQIAADRDNAAAYFCGGRSR
ncbi:MAG TPA: riboflavin biosynthesis protein RibF [Opitutales bacterium]|nr:riboflavin biosynthesis protein RibF [Opitutales bacterium]